MDKPRVAGIQLNSSHEVAINLEKMSYWIEKAAQSGANLIVLPENVVLMGKSENDKINIAETFGHGPIQALFGKLSKKYKIWLLAGTLPLKTEQKTHVTASSLLYNSEGNCVARYDKIHLFDVVVQPGKEVHQESKSIVPGQEIVSVKSPLGKIGLSICYDLRFPELFRKLFNQGVELFLLPAAFTQITGEAHWEVLIRARAIENFSYVVASAQTGTHSNGRTTFGHSMIVDPWGKILDQLPEEEGVVMAEIDLDYLYDLRQRFPVLEHQRLH